MAKLSNVLRSVAGGCVGFWCPGCDEAHVIRVDGPSAWGFDGNVGAPTFSPSVLVTGVKMTPEADAMIARGESPEGGSYPTVPQRCHSFVRAGRIEFLSDCTHALAGQTVPLPAWPESFSDGDTPAPAESHKEGN